MNQPSEQPPISRNRLMMLVLIAVTSLGIVGCAVIAAPFVPALAWAVALAVVAHPVHERIARWVRQPSLAAGIAVGVITVGLLAPTILVAREVAGQATAGLQGLEERIRSGELASAIQRHPTTAALARWAGRNVDVDEELRQLGDSVRSRLGGWVRSAVWTAVQILVTIFLLFYLLRDRREAIRAACSFLPLSNREAGQVIERVRAMIRATIYGTVVVAAVQGALGGIMFRILGIPGALPWGVAMGLLSIVPVLGAFVIWLPAAIGLAAQGEWAKALLLTGWGTLVVGLIDNLLYPVLVGKEIRLHTVPVFIAIVGGLLAFGASGVVIGPVILAITLACLDVLRRRTEGNRPTEDPT